MKQFRPALRDGIVFFTSAALVAAAFTPLRASAQTSGGASFTTVYSFQNFTDSVREPNGGLVVDPSGLLYGTTVRGGNDEGVIYSLTPGSTPTTLHAFGADSGSYTNTDGETAEGSLVRDASGNLYGDTLSGGTTGDGTVFKITPGGAFSVLYTFTGGADGTSPSAGLLLGADGNLYGTTSLGGAHQEGAVFKVTPSGAFSTVYSFTGGSDGERPTIGLVQGQDGNFYGTAISGTGASLYGTVFQLTPTGVLTTLYLFTNGSDGQQPRSGLVQGSDGDFYGATTYGGPNDNGALYKITPTGTFTLLHTFSATDANQVNADGANTYNTMILGTDGNLYGTTYAGGTHGDGTIFQLTPSGALTTLYAFTGGTDGASPAGKLLESEGGTLYGTTPQGGTNGTGSIFALSVPSLTGGLQTGSGVRFDFNGDGHADLLWRNTQSGALSVWEMNDQQVLNFGEAFATVDPASGWQPAASVDVNGDGYPDLIWWNSQTGELSNWTLHGESVASYGGDFAQVTNTNWKPVAAAEVTDNTAGSPTTWNLIFQNTATGDISRWLMNGTTATQYGGTLGSLGAGSPWQIVGAPDLDSDGKSDLLFWNSSTGEVNWWGCNLASNQVLSYNNDFAQVQDTSWHLVGSEDTNGDGHPDLIWWNAGSGAVSRWLLSGTTVTSYGSDFAQVPNTAWQPTAIR